MSGWARPTTSAPRGLVKVAGTIDGEPFCAARSWRWAAAPTSSRSELTSTGRSARRRATPWPSASRAPDRLAGEGSARPCCRRNSAVTWSLDAGGEQRYSSAAASPRRPRSAVDGDASSPSTASSAASSSDRAWIVGDLPSRPAMLGGHAGAEEVAELRAVGKRSCRHGWAATSLTRSPTARARARRPTTVQGLRPGPVAAEAAPRAVLPGVPAATFCWAPARLAAARA